MSTELQVRATKAWRSTCPAINGQVVALRAPSFIILPTTCHLQGSSYDIGNLRNECTIQRSYVRRYVRPFGWKWEQVQGDTHDAMSGRWETVPVGDSLLPFRISSHWFDVGGSYIWDILRTPLFLQKQRYRWSTAPTIGPPDAYTYTVRTYKHYNTGLHR